MDNKTVRERAFKLMTQALVELRRLNRLDDLITRELALTKTKLEEAIMWNNKDRAIIGELEKSDTFV